MRACRDGSLHSTMGGPWFSVRWLDDLMHKLHLVPGGYLVPTTWLCGWRERSDSRRYRKAMFGPLSALDLARLRQAHAEGKIPVRRMTPSEPGHSLYGDIHARRHPGASGFCGRCGFCLACNPHRHPDSSLLNWEDHD